MGHPAGSLRIDEETGNWAPTQAVLDRINAGKTFFVAVGSTSALANNLSYALDRPVIDESGIDGSYAFHFPWSGGKTTPSEAVQAIKNKYGVTLPPARREVDMLAVRKGNDE